MPGTEEKSTCVTSIFTTIKPTVSINLNNISFHLQQAFLRFVGQICSVISPRPAVPLGTCETFNHSTATSSNTITKQRLPLDNDGKTQREAKLTVFNYLLLYR